MKIRLKKGHNLSLAGAVENVAAIEKVDVSEFAIIPDDFTGFLPKLDVKEGDLVSAGQPLMHDKAFEQIKVVSPAAGQVAAVVRGERRKIERIVVKVAANAAAEAQIAVPTNADGAVRLLCQSGFLARMRQRPYDIVPRPSALPRDIFVTAIDSAPLAVGYGTAVRGKQKEMAAAVALLKKVTKGKVYVSVASDWAEGDIAGAEMVTVEGKHPAGNVGVQIANIAPVNKGEVVWTLDVATLVKLGEYLLTGKYDGETVVAITGSEIEAPSMVRTVEGAKLSELLKGRIKKDAGHVRIISGNVLTGSAEPEDAYLRFPYRQVTVIPEGDDADEFMGWASLSPSKLSIGRTFPNFAKKLFRPDARMLGGRRAMIMSGEYDKMMPMDIMPEYLIKAILAKDIEQMEKLGIYEVAPEDFALAEFADTSKLPLQQIVREGLDYLRKELE